MVTLLVTMRVLKEPENLELAIEQVSLSASSCDVLIGGDFSKFLDGLKDEALERARGELKDCIAAKLVSP